MEKQKVADLKLYLQEDSVLVTAVKLTAFYNLNTALHEFEEATTLQKNEIISIHSYQDNRRPDALVNATEKVVHQLSSLLDNSSLSILHKEFALSNTLIIRCANALSRIPKTLPLNEKGMQDTLEKLANCILDTIYMTPKSLINGAEHRTYYLGAEKAIFIGYQNVFRAKFEYFIEKQLGSVVNVKDISVEAIVTNTTNLELTELLLAVSHSALLFNQMLQILLEYFIATNLNVRFLRFSQCVIGAFHRLCSNSTGLNPANVYIPPLQAVVNLVQAILGVDLNDSEMIHKERSLDNNVHKRLLKETLMKLTKLLQTPRYTYITKVLMTIVIPYKALCDFITFSIKEEMELHTVI